MSALSPAPGSGFQLQLAQRTATSCWVGPGTHRWAWLPHLPFLPLLSWVPRKAIFSLQSCRPSLSWGALGTRRAHISRFASRSLEERSTTRIRYTDGETRGKNKKEWPGGGC